MLGDRLGVVDLHQHGARGDVLAALDRDLGDAPVDPRGDVEPRRVDLALHQQRLRPHQIPDRQAGDDGDDHADNDRRNAWAPPFRPASFGASASVACVFDLGVCTSIVSLRAQPTDFQAWGICLGAPYCADFCCLFLG